MKTQEEIDKERREMAEVVVRDRSLTTLEEAKGFATEWIIIAAQHCANEEYYRNGRDVETHRKKLLSEALRKTLIRAEVIRPDAQPSGPALLNLAENYIRS